AYVWAETYYAETQQDLGWNNLYKQIYVSNDVIDGVMDSRNGTDAEKKSISAEALVQRAAAYLSLVNQYAPIYDPATAESKDGVPLLLAPGLFQDLKRAKLKAVYDQIIKDANNAIEALPETPAFNTKPSKAAAYALLARTYLITRDFEKAAENAGKALAIQSTLNNLETYSTNASLYPRKLADPETILSKTVAGFFEAKLNDELLALFDTRDLRYSMFTREDASVGGRRYSKHNVTFEGRYVGLSVPEMILTMAEYYARIGNADKVNELLNRLRSKRFKTADYTPLALTSSSDLLGEVIKERRRELMGTGLRWFDQRRLSLDPAFAKDVVRVFNGQTYTLSPGSNRFVYPINDAILKLNPEIGQNPR
ncbi:RagB/SusD family nutrient uptake outer membrane protein, partial [Pararcticibacter amylolyticus]|uniref:RagB/SusD family nutrient uptake outer membrane protein n=1 Tax=Pararcticibacter amylolyticus TaxID=2173175 RepID=UPI00130485C3